MIGKQTKGKSFRGVLNYLHDHESSRIIGGNMAGDTPRVMSAEFAVARKLNPRLEKAVYHSSLSLPLGEHLDDETWNALASDYIKGMDFTQCQYVVYRHSDKDHDHIHIVASRIRITDGTTVSDSWDYVRSEQLIRDLETKYKLTPTHSSNQKRKRGQTSGEMRLIERTGTRSVRDLLQTIIDKETSKPTSMPELVGRLKNKGIDAKITVTRTGKIKGISYQLDGVATSGTHLGKAYTFNGLQKYKQVSYDDKFERSELIKASKRLARITATEPIKSNPTVGQKEQLARALVKQLKYHRQINQRLRTVPGKLVLLGGGKEIRILATSKGFDIKQQEKLVIQQNEFGWGIVKYQLDEKQRQTLFEVLNSIEQQPNINRNVGESTQSQQNNVDRRKGKSK